MLLLTLDPFLLEGSDSVIQHDKLPSLRWPRARPHHLFPITIICNNSLLALALDADETLFMSLPVTLASLWVLLLLAEKVYL